MGEISEKLRKFIEMADEDEELEASIRAAIESNDASKLVELAHQKGIELTEADFAQREMAEIDEEELEAVAGGLKPHCHSKMDAFLCGLAAGTDVFV